MTIIGSPWMVIKKQLCNCGNLLEAKTRFIKIDSFPESYLEWYWKCLVCDNEYELRIDKESHQALVYKEK
jgi:hypothetical protein